MSDGGNMIKGQTNNFIQVVNNVTASRAFTTTYTNTTGRTLYVLVTVYLQITLAGGTAFVQALVNAISYLSGLANAANGHNEYRICSFFVPPGATYRLNKTEANGTCTIQTWIEAY